MKVKSFNRRLEALRMPIECLVARSKVTAKRVEALLAQKAPKGKDWVALCDAVGCGPLRPPTTPAEYREQQARVKAERVCGLTQGGSALEGKGLTPALLDKQIFHTSQELLASDDPNRLWWPL
jgi:hypothetical protein